MRWLIVAGVTLLLSSGGPAAAQPASPSPPGRLAALAHSLNTSVSRLSTAGGRLSACLQQRICRIATRAHWAGSRAKDGVLDLKDRLAAFKARLPSLWLLKRRLLEGNPGKKWTVFVYMNGDNNLHAAGLEDLREMAQVGSNENLNIVALWDGSERYTDGENHRSKLLLVEKGGTKVLKELGELNMGDPATLQQHLTSVMQEFPAERTAVVVWNHGAGWRGASFDEEPAASCSLPGLGHALASVRDSVGRKVDLLGFDACMMSMAEVSHEVASSANTCVGSEEVEPAKGWDYQAFLGALAAKPNMDSKELAATIVDTYTNSYAGGSQGREAFACASAIDLASYQRASRQLDDFARALQRGLAGGERAAIDAAAKNSLRFYYDDHVDLVDFARNVAAATNSEELKRCATRLDEVLTQEVITHNAKVGPSAPGLPDLYANAHGISIFLPKNRWQHEGSKAQYGELAMSRESPWRDMLDTYFPPPTAAEQSSAPPPPVRPPYPGYGVEHPTIR